MLVTSPALVAISIVLFIFVHIAGIQLCLSSTGSTDSSHALTLKSGIFVALIVEFAQSVVQLVFAYCKTNPQTVHNCKPLVNFLFWCLFLSLSYVTHHLVKSLTPKIEHFKPNRRKILSCLKRIWLILSIAHSAWILICFILFVVTSSTLYQDLYYFGFYLYLTLGCFFILFTSFHVKSAIDLSITNIDRQCSSACNTYNIYETDVKNSNNIGLVQKHLQQLFAANCHINIVMLLAFAVLIITAIGVFFTITDMTSMKMNQDKKSLVHSFITMDSFIIHYLYVFIFYCLPLIIHWIPLKEAPVDSLYHKTFSKLNSAAVVKKQQTMEQMKANAEEPNKEEIKTEIVVTLQTTAAISMVMPNDHTIELKSNELYLSHDYNEVADPELSYTRANDNRLSPSKLQLSLQKINSEGRPIGQRGVAKPNRIQCKTEKPRLSSINTEVSPVDSEESLQPMTLMDIVDTISASDTEISLIIFRFADVLCTNINKLRNKSQHNLDYMSMTAKELCFGGKERIQNLRMFLANVCNKGVKCFVMTDEKSKMVAKLLNDVHLLKYFVTKKDSDVTHGYISNIIGFDHFMHREAEGKKHLILLKLLHVLDTRHEEMLYVEHDEEVLDHIKCIKLCRTFFCETKGLTNDSLDEIMSIYF